MKILFFILLSASMTSCAVETIASLKGELDDVEPSRMIEKYLKEKAQEAFDRRAARFESLTSIEAIRSYQQELRSFFLTQLGEFPERSPLNAQTVGGGETEWFTYERIMFESRPGFYVTGILYLPKSSGPFPGVIVPCGHSANGKAAESYQRVCMLLAANGIAAFCYDPIGQGERYAYLREDGSNEFDSTLEHTLIGVGAILVGANTAIYRIWDGMRALDFLSSRPEIDASRIGCTGNSGGGILTSYLMALDDRIRCAAPSCYLTTFERLIHTIGPQDAEQNIFGQIRFGMDHADYIHLRAPAPTLICAATKDFFDITGTWKTFREAKRLYARFGCSEHIDLIEFDGNHGFSKPLREAAVRWMLRWLAGLDQPVNEPEFPIFRDEELLCSPEGQVIRIPGAITALDLNVQRAQALEKKRADFRAQSDDAEFRKKIREVIGLDRVDVPKTEVKVISMPVRKDMSREMVILKPEQGIALRLYIMKPKQVLKDTILICPEKGLEQVFEEEAWCIDLLRAGHVVCWAELRGFGETAANSTAMCWENQVGADWQIVFLAYLLGKSFVGMRTYDIWSVAHYLSAREGRPIRLMASGQSTVPALHAAALWPELFSHIHLENGIPSWTEVVNTPRAKQQLINAVHNALAWYDLPDLVDLLPQEKIVMANMAVPTF